jgi:distribution and morphology protein 12
MSIDLDWGLLDSSLASSIVDLLNRQIASTPRPSFIGPIEVASLDFGSTPPDIEIVDLRDIYRDFLDADDEDEEDISPDPVKVTEGATDEDAFEWVSRRATWRAKSQDMPAYHHMPPHVRYGRSASADVIASTPALHSPRDIWNGTMSGSLPSLADFRPATFGASFLKDPIPYTPISTSHRPKFELQPVETPLEASASQYSFPSVDPPSDDGNEMNLQIHLRITWHSDLRLTLTTSLLINYPSPMFMSLPIKLSVTGLVFNGEIAIAYEGSRHRVHLCIVDDLDPYGPIGGRSKCDAMGSNTPPNLDDDSPSSSAHQARYAPPLPIGRRLLPNIYIESEIGQADNHVLKNVTKVEKFIQDIIRATVEEELVFPHFHTIVLQDP